MRLICPRCGAHYEVETAAIPANGREVECSACDHVWRANRTTQAFDPADRPKLSRELSESVVGILREEAARELQARAAEQSERTPRVPTPAAPVGTPTSAPAATPGVSAPAAMLDWGPNGDTLPGDIPRPASERDDYLGPLSEETRVWRRGAARSKDADAHPAPRLPETATGPVTPAPTTNPAPAEPQVGAPEGAAKADHTAPEAPVPTVSSPPPPAPAPARTPPPGPAPDPVRPEPAREAAPQAAPPVREAVVPPRPPRTGYATGFRLAVIVALAAVALYALAPRLADQGAIGQRLTEWRSSVDQGRDWLAARAGALVAQVRGTD